jgi:hypothetical protein
MTKSAISFETVRGIGLTLPGVEEGTAYGSPALRVRGKMMAVVPVNPSAEPGSLAVCVDREQRAALLAEAPEIYYVTPHYEGYDWVLVRLGRIDRGMLKDLLGMAHKFVTRKGASRAAGAKRGKPRSRK